MTGIELDHDKYSAYLNQHLVAADAGVEAFKAAADTWAGTEWEATFLQLHKELNDSHDEVERLIKDLGYELSTGRTLLAGVAKAAGRLNPINVTRNADGTMTQMELDALVAAVRAQQMMWETLLLLGSVDPRLDKTFSQTMIDRCADQRARVVRVSTATAVDRFTLNTAERRGE